MNLKARKKKIKPKNLRTLTPKSLWFLRPKKIMGYGPKKSKKFKGQKLMEMTAQEPMNLKPPKNVNFINLWILRPKNPWTRYFKNLGILRAKQRQSARISKTMNNHINEPSVTTIYEFKNESKNTIWKKQCLELCYSKGSNSIFPFDLFHCWKKRTRFLHIPFWPPDLDCLAVRALSTSLPNMATGHLT